MELVSVDKLVDVQTTPEGVGPIAPGESDALISSIAPWFGSKRTLGARIARECCRADGKAPRSFWDLGCGSLAVSLAMPRVSHHHAVDLHDDLTNLARVIADRVLGPQLYRRLRRVVCHEVLFQEAKAALEADDRRKAIDAGLFDDGAQGRELNALERAVLYFVISWQGRNGVAGTERVNHQPAVRWTSGGGHGGIRVANAVASIPAWRRRMRGMTIIQRDMFIVLGKIADEKGTSIYVDPPYLRSGARTGNCSYLHEFSDKDHDRLREALTRFKDCRVVMSYYDHPTVREWYAGWTFVDCMMQKNLHVQNRRGVGRCESPEVLIINGESYSAPGSASPRLGKAAGKRQKRGGAA